MSTNAPDQNASAKQAWTQRLAVIIYVAAACCGILLAAAFAAASAWAYAGVSVSIIGLVVLAEEINKLRWLSSLAFAAFVFMGMLLLWRGAPALPALAATTAALAAWDLHAFRERILSVGKLPTPDAHVTQHLRRLAITLSIGLGLGLLGIWVQIDVSTLAVAGLITLAAIGLTGTVGYLHRSSD